ncbi:MAG: serine/threonine-protein phosphatase [Methyloprofundus sp.]|nr:serine/threonine-protein phosphatase [Methyloprofundus sp.]
MFKIDIHQLTSIGDKANNQDYMLSKFDKEFALFIVADGLGGHKAGEIASRYFCHSFVTLASKFGPVVKKAPKKVVLMWFNAAVKLMAHAFIDNPDAQKSHTTCVILLVMEDYVIAAHCGDSRIYRINDERILWRTKDHSVPQKLMDEGALLEHRMGTHPEQNQLTRSVNIANKFAPDVHIYPAPEPGDTFILCTDGFWEFTKEYELIGLASGEMDKSRLLKQAKMAHLRANGHGDNLTAQWIRIGHKI